MVSFIPKKNIVFALMIMAVSVTGCCTFFSRSGGVQELVVEDEEYLKMLATTPQRLIPLTAKPTLSPTAALQAAAETGKIKGVKKELTASPTPTPTYEFAHLLGEPTPVLGRPFAPGEKLVFNVSFMGMVLGKATWQVGEMEYVDGHYCYHVIGLARTSYVFRFLYPVKDRVEAWIDFHGLFPWKFRKQLNEFTYHIDEIRIYDQINHLIWWEEVKNHVIPPRTKGMISCFFYFRALPLEVGKDVSFWVNSGVKNYELLVKVHRKERVKVKAGEFDCIVVEPFVKHEGLFDTRGKLLVWLTDDHRHAPVKVKGRLSVVGSLKFELVEAVFAN